MKLLGKRVIFEIIEEAKEDKPASVIILTTPEEEKPYVIGKIIAVGDECSLTKGKKILLNRHAADKIVWNEKDMWIIEPNLIIAIE